MKRYIAVVVGFAFLAGMFLAGCVGGGGGVGYGLSLKKLGKEKVVEKSGKRPDWAFDKPTFMKNGVLYAVGFFSDAPNLGKGLEVATKLAQAKIAESIRMRLKDDFTYASEGLDVESTVLDRILNTTTEEMVIRRFFQNKLYYEKKQFLSPAWVDTPHARSGRDEMFVGLSTQNEKLEDGITLAVENANGAIVEAVGQVIQKRSQGVLTMDADDIRESFGSAGAASYLKHKERKAIYYEKWASYDKCKPKYHYNVWVQVAVPRSEFDAEAVRAESYLKGLQRAEETKAKPPLMPAPASGIIFGEGDPSPPAGRQVGSRHKNVGGQAGLLRKFHFRRIFFCGNAIRDDAWRV